MEREGRKVAWVLQIISEVDQDHHVPMQLCEGNQNRFRAHNLLGGKRYVIESFEKMRMTQ